MSEDSTIYNTNINVGAPPLLWSTVDEAFRQINANFEIISATLGESGITPLNFNDLDSSVKPADSNVYQLGDDTYRWKNVWLAETSDVPENEENGIWLGTAQIEGINGTVNLPANSTVDGNLIIDPINTWYKSIQIDDGDFLEAQATNSVLKIDSGFGIDIVVDSPAESFTINNTGILSASAGLGISVSGTDPLIIGNTGVRTIGPVTALPGTLVAGTGIAVSSATGTPVITNTGIVGLTAGYGIIINPDINTGVSGIQFNPAVAPTAAYTTIQIAGQQSIQPPLNATSTTSALIIQSTNNIEITATPIVPGGNDTITIGFNNRIDIIGSVFSDDSTMMVDATNGTFIGDLKGSVVADNSTVLVNAVDGTLHGNFIGSVFADDSTQIIDGNSFTVYGNIEATTLRTAETKIALGLSTGVGQGANSIAIGEQAGETTQGNRALAIGFQAAYVNQGVRGIAIGQAAANSNQGANGIAIGETAGAGYQGVDAIAIGQNAGLTSQGTNAIAIGKGAGSNNQPAGSIILNASGSTQDAAAAGFYVNPVRSTTSSARPVVYDSTTKELFYTSTLEFINSTISTTDSSGLTVDVLTRFNSDVVIENELIVAVELTLKGSRVINLDELKTIVAASSDFNDFKIRMAALS